MVIDIIVLSAGIAALQLKNYTFVSIMKFYATKLNKNLKINHARYLTYLGFFPKFAIYLVGEIFLSYYVNYNW